MPLDFPSTPTDGEKWVGGNGVTYIWVAVYGVWMPDPGQWAPQDSPHLTGDPTAPTPATSDNDTTIATTAFVQAVVNGTLAATLGTAAYKNIGTSGNTVPVLDAANTWSLAQAFTVSPTVPTQTAGDATTKVASTAFVAAAITGLSIGSYAPLASPVFTGDPQAPNPATGDNDTSIATTAFVKAQAYITAAALTPYAPLASPTFTGTPAAPTATQGTSTTQIATTAFVNAEIAADVAAMNLAPLASPIFTGDPRAPTPTPGDNDTSIATTAFVAAAISSQSHVLSWSGGTTGLLPSSPTAGAVVLSGTLGVANGGTGVTTSTGSGANVLNDSPALAGTPTAPTAGTGINSTQIATTAFVKSLGYETVANVALKADIASPTFTGDPKAPTPATSDNDTSIATTAYVKNQGYQVASEKGVANGYASLDSGGKVPAGQLPAYVDDVLEYANLAAFPATGQTGVIYVALDTNRTYRWSGSVYVEISPSPGSTDAVPEGSLNLYYTDSRAQAANAAAIALKANIASPVFTGDPQAPTPANGDNDTSIATTAFVKNQAYITFAALAPYALINSPAFTGNPTAPTPGAGDNDTSIATTAFVQSEIAAGLVAYAPLASPALTGTPTAPTATAGTNTTQIASTAFVGAAITAIPAKQPLDGDLTALAALTGTNTIYYRSAADTWSAVTMGAGMSFSGGTLATTVSIAGLAPINSPTFTGDPQAPTPAASDNDTSIATTAFVKTAIASGAPVAMSATAPSSPYDGQLWFNTELLVLFVRYNDGTSTQWVSAGGGGGPASGSEILPGMCMDYFGGSVPVGWYLCDGSSKSTTTDATLFAAIGYTYGGSGANFNLPDCRGRVLAMIDGGSGRLSTLTAVGAVGGDQSLQAHTHAPGSFATPDHLHSVGSLYAANHDHAITQGGPGPTSYTARAAFGDGTNAGLYGGVLGGSGNLGIGGATGAADRSLALAGTSGSTGAGAGQNLQPTMAINKLIKR